MDLLQFTKAVGATRSMLANKPPCRVPDKPWVTEHLQWMLNECVSFYRDGRHEKANRWLGFVQGCMACQGHKLDDLKRANMPEGDQFDGEKV